MFMGLFLILVVAWLVSWLALHITSGLIHLLIIAAVISLIGHFVMGRRPV